MKSEHPQRGLRTASIALAVVACAQEGSVAPGAPGAPEDASRPNIVLLVLDTLRADKLSCYGFPDETSPELDRLAEQGVLFERALAPSSWTRPSMGALLTGLYPRQLGIYREEGDILDDRFETLVETLRAAGYRTLGLTANPNVNSAFNFQQGFDLYADSAVTWAWMNAGGRTEEVSRLVSANELFRTALAWLREDSSAPSAPVFLNVNVMEVHEHEQTGFRSLLRPEFAERFADRPNAGYLRATAQLSFDVAAFVEQLVALPGWEDTLVVIVSDHGEGLDDHPDVPDARHHGQVVYRSQAEVPWILYRTRWPAGFEAAARGLRVARTVRLLDLTPTLLDLANVESSARYEGESLVPLLRGEELDGPEHVFVETRFRGRHKLAVYTDDWCYVENREARLPATLDARELQPAEGAQNGAATSVLEEKREAGDALRDAAARWEARVPEEPPVVRGISEEARRALDAAGYSGGD